MADIPTGAKLTMDLHLRDGPHRPSWWKSATVYQIWPASFKDSTGSGLGDLRGILSKLDYLASLGVDTIWLSPMYDSPQEDMGYDIADYNAVYPPYGTMDDMDELIAGCHNRGIRVLLDLVVNHTSDQHEWFKKSREGEGKYRDFYIWRDGRVVDEEVKEPSNWGSMFGGSAWKWDEGRKQYYLHLFAEGQPDLNWRCEDLRREVREKAIKWWLRKGVNGFRVDTCCIYDKNPDFPDADVDERFKPWGNPLPFVLDGPNMHGYWKEIRREALDEFGDVMMVGELGGVDFDGIVKYVSSDERELSMVFDFDFATLGGLHAALPHLIWEYKLPEMKKALGITQKLVMHPTTWSSMWKENHDMPRSVSRHGSKDPKYWERSAKLLSVLTGTLSGTLFLYQGEEIGMTNIPKDWTVDDLRDVWSISYMKKMKEQYPNDKELLKKAWEGVTKVSRDNARTPVQWSSEKHAGFTTGAPWMRVNDNYNRINVADEEGRKDSILSFWRKMIKIRKEHHHLFVSGDYRVHDFNNEKTYTFVKEDNKGAAAIVVLNFSQEQQDVDPPDDVDKGKMELLVSTIDSRDVKLQAWEGRIYLYTKRQHE